MSGKVVSWAFEQVTGSPAAKLVLVKLADNANDYGLCWVGVEKVIIESELSQSAVYKHLSALQTAGLVRSFETTHPEHGYPIKAFQLSVPEAWQAIPPRGKAKAAIPPGGKMIPPRGKEIPPEGKTIPPGGIPYKEEPSPEPPIEPSSEPGAAAPRAATPQGGLFDTSDDPSQPDPGGPLPAAYAAYAEFAERNGWTQIRGPSGARDASLRRRLKTVGGQKGWIEALQRAEASDFLSGRVPGRDGKPPFLLTFDFLIGEKNFLKLLEGNYDNRAGSAPAGGGSYLAAAGQVAARRAAADPH